ncbi:hypothetical protein DFJ73DRAFT_798502 [Zopfochytrium polystomum]|nr:hypothetical protein DFJ73DRAFT_798502 [Zopfochytrium polystomum]
MASSSSSASTSDAAAAASGAEVASATTNGLKLAFGAAGALWTPENVTAVLDVDVYYIHAPDRKTPPIADTLAGIDALYKQGRFRRFGLSNFFPTEVEEVVRVAKEHGYVVPTVYQGNYFIGGHAPAGDRAASRPAAQRNRVLRLLADRRRVSLQRPRAAIEGGRRRTVRQGRRPARGLYMSMYVKPAYLDALDGWCGGGATRPPSRRQELANRWIVYTARCGPS